MIEETMKGYQIVCEGVDAGGKTTIVKRVVQWLNENGINAISTHHPGSTPLGQNLRNLINNKELSVDANTRGLLFAADNSAYITSVLKPELEKGTWVVADRNNFISSMAYQIADGCSVDELDHIHAATYDLTQVPPIDLLLILRIDYATANARREKGRSKTEKNETFEKKMASPEFFKKVSDAYDRLMDEQPDKLLKFVRHTDGGVAPHGTPRCLYIDATKSEDEVFNSVIEAIKATLYKPEPASS